jgi:hypothetical protein
MSDLTGWHVHGPVRMLRREHAEWDAARDTWNEPRGLTVVSFRPDGQFLTSEFHNPDGSVARSSCAYDESGRLLETQWSMNDVPGLRLLYSYDSLGRRVEAVEVAVDGARRPIESWQYDHGGRTLKRRVLEAQPAGVCSTGECSSVMYAIEGTDGAYSAPGAVSSTTVYDDRQLPSEVTFHDSQDGLVLRVVLTRDDEGRLINEQASYGGLGPLYPSDAALAKASPEDRAELVAVLATVFGNGSFAQATYAYDARGRLVERVRRLGNLSEDRTTFRYEDRDEPIEEILDERNQRLEPDEQGVMQTNEEEPRRHEYRFEYDYDAHGNWTTRVVSIRISPQTELQRSNVERRTITYY